jgi:hypothetical protein
MPSPTGAAELEAVGEVEAVGVVFVAFGGVQDLSNKLPAALAPKIKISRRRIFLAIEINYSSSVREMFQTDLALQDNFDRVRARRLHSDAKWKVRKILYPKTPVTQYTIAVENWLVVL